MNRPIRACLLGMGLAVATLPLQAQDKEWWFDVEILLYKQDQALERLDELFVQPVPVPETGRSVDLISSYLLPDIRALRAALPMCTPSSDEPVESFPLVDETLQAELKSALQNVPQPQSRTSLMGQSSINLPAKVAVGNWSGLLQAGCQYEFEQTMLADLLFPAPQPRTFIANVPVVLSGKLVDYPQSAHLLPGSEFKLRDLARDLHRQRGIQPLLHLAWRQEVLFGKSRAQSFRLFGGTNFSRVYGVDGYPLGEEKVDTTVAETDLDQQSLLDRITRALAEPLVLKVDRMRTQDNMQQVGELWELDGNFKVYLQYFNRVPYLHIDTDLVYRKEGPPGLMETQAARIPAELDPALDATDAPQYQLYGLPFDQLRRIISNQIHYFDHPMFGMVVQLRRYHRPAPPLAEAAQ